MNAEKYTEKSLEALRLAQSLSKQKHSPQIEQEHLLLALLTQQGGLIPQLLQKMGQDLTAEEKLKELVGHTLPQVLVGAVLGILIGVGVSII